MIPVRCSTRNFTSECEVTHRYMCSHGHPPASVNAWPRNSARTRSANAISALSFRGMSVSYVTAGMWRVRRATLTQRFAWPRKASKALAARSSRIAAIAATTVVAT